MKIFSQVLFALSLQFVSAISYAQIEASYEVPASDPSLQVSAIFELKKIKIEQTGTHLKMKYLVPQELTGHRNVLEFEGEMNAGQGSLFYKDAQMDCLSDESTMKCKVTYQQLKFNQARAEKMMARKFQGEELLRRMMVQKDFSTDPVGIIQIKLK